MQQLQNRSGQPTFDGGSVSHFLGHVTGGFKLFDSRSKHPRTNDPLFGDSGHSKL
jgi:hypothetical protein